MSKPNIFFRLIKVDVAKRLVEGIATAEILDKSGEICDYESTKPYFEKWSDGFKKATDGKSLGNLRAMHSNIAAGKLTEILFDDVAKAIRIIAKVVDDAEWNKVLEGVYTGFSQGGEYVKKWKDGDATRYTADPTEISIVDNPCLGAATFEVVKADGSVAMQKFHVEQPAPELEQVWKAKDGTTFATKAEAQKHNIGVDAQASVSKTISGVEKLISDINADLDKRDAPVKTEDTPPEKKVDENAGSLAKLLKSTTWDCRTSLDALSSIKYLITSELLDGADAGQMADLKEACSRLKSFIAAEVMEDEPEALEAAKLAADLEKAKAASDHMEHVHAIHKAASGIMQHCMKCMGADHEKFVKAVGEDNAGHIGAIHKKANTIADHCMKMGSKMDAEKAIEVDIEDDSSLVKMSAVNDVLTKTITGLASQLGELQKRLKIVEDQPAARKGAVFAVERSHEVDPGNLPAEAVKKSPFNLSSLRLSPEELRGLVFQK